jgi:hypothetical protein
MTLAYYRYRLKNVTSDISSISARSVAANIVPSMGNFLFLDTMDRLEELEIKIKELAKKEAS